MKGKGKKIKENERKRREIKEKVSERKDNPRVFAGILEEDSVDAFTFFVTDHCTIALHIKKTQENE